MSRFISLAAFLVLIFLIAPHATAQIELSGGYSNLHLDGADQNLHDANGFGLDLRAGGPILPGPVISNLRLGVDVGWRRYNTDGSGSTPFEPDKSDLDLFSFEGRAAWRQPLGPFFIEPSIAAGGLVGVYSSENHFNLTNFDQTEVGWSIRPGLGAGVHIGLFSAGVEGSYRWGHLAFDNGVGGDLHEWYAGVFAGISF